MEKLERMKRNSSKKDTISFSKRSFLFSLFASPVCGVGLGNSTCGVGAAGKGRSQSRFASELLMHFVGWGGQQMFFCEGSLFQSLQAIRSLSQLLSTAFAAQKQP